MTLVPVALFVAVGTVGLTLYANWRPSEFKGWGQWGKIGQGFAQAAQAFEIGGTSANAASIIAASRTPGSVSASTLDQALPKYTWVNGAATVPPSSVKRPIVGVNVIGNDVETAVQPAPGLCSYGLSVRSNSDPLIAEDHLPGPGTYYQLGNAPCVANQAPT